MMNRSQELKLIRKAAAGDRSASGQLIRNHQGSLYAYLLRMSGRPDVAEDAVQEAFVRVLTNLDRFDSRFRFSTWLFTIGRRVFLNMVEKKRPSSDSEAVADWLGPVTGPCRSVDHDDARDLCRDLLQSALMMLSPEQREVLVLFHQHEWPIWLIGDHMGMPEGTVKSHLHRARIRLRDVLTSRAVHPGVETLKLVESWS